MPLTKLATPRCQTSSRPASARPSKTMADTKVTRTESAMPRRNGSRVARTPNGSPNKPIGSSLSMVIVATMKGEAVCS
ncbi:MAG: hypothetical protein R3E48_08170 [Burkholderiaceae bacterium]